MVAGVKKIISGGQTGVDRAALDVALELGIPLGGWCPRGRLAEDGIIDQRYPLQETPSTDYVQRTEWNVRDADGTLIIAFKVPSGGTAFTIECARNHHKPLLMIDMHDAVESIAFRRWLTEHKIATLNVAGPRESHAPGVISTRAREILRELLK